MGYRETLDWLYSLETMGIKLGLDNVSELLERLGNPQRSFKSVHVGGTNGKGSVCAMTASIIREAGHCAGLYTSPHIIDFRERIQVGGDQISEPELMSLIEEIRPIVDEMARSGAEKRLTFFEITTALAFRHFADKGVEHAVVEVGMGGRLDATNVICPECSIITRIGLEHTRYLGSTIPQIAYEKAGIIKPGVPVLTAERNREALEVIRRVAKERNAPLRIVGRGMKYELVSYGIDGIAVRFGKEGPVCHIPLPGRFQAANSALAYGCVEELRRRGAAIGEEDVVAGLGKVRWPGRMEVLRRSPLVMLDASHTPDGAAVVSEEIRRVAKGRVILVLGVLEDKDVQSIAKHFGRIASVAIAAAPRTKRAFPAEAVRDALEPHCERVEVVKDVGEAFERALSYAGPGDTVVVTGSLYTIGEGRAWWDSHEAS